MEKILKIQSIPFFSNYTESKLLLISGIMKTSKMSKGQVILQEGKPVTEFLFVLEGELRVFKKIDIDGKDVQVMIGTYIKHNYFGEEAVIENKNDDSIINSSITVSCKTDVMLGIFTIYDAITKFKSVIQMSELLKISLNPRLVKRAHFNNLQEQNWQNRKKTILLAIKDIYKEKEKKKNERRW